MADLKLLLVAVSLLIIHGSGEDFKDLQHVDDLYPKLFQNENRHPASFYQPLVKETLSEPYLRHTPIHMHQVNKRQTSSGVYGNNFDPNKFNSQIGANYDPNALNGMGSSGVSSGMPSTGAGSASGTGSSNSGTSSSGGGMTSMFNPNAMMSGGSSGGSSGGMSMFGNPSAMMGGGSSSGTSSATGGSSQSGTSSVSKPNYDPNNVVNTGAKYDPNAAGNPGGGGGGSSPVFANSMGMNASQQSSSGGPPGSGSNTGSSSGSGPGSQNPAASFGSSANSFGSSSSGSSSGSQSSGSSGVSSGGSSQSGGGSNGSSAGFDPVKTNSMATDGFNPLNPMIGKDINSILGQQSQSGSGSGSNSFGFDPSKMNAQLGSQGMSLNMFGGAGGNTNLNKADASSISSGAQGMMAGSNTLLGGGNTVMNGGGNMGTGGQPSVASSGSSTFDPNKAGNSTGSGSASASGTFDPNLQSGSSNSGSGSTSSSSKSGGTTGSNSGGMNMFNPNAMMGGGSMNPLMPGGGMNPMMPGGNTNPMMPSGSMTGNRAGGNSILDPLGAMTGGAKNFSGGNSLIDPMGFMGGGGLTGGMGNVFSPQGRSIPITSVSERHRRDSGEVWRNGNLMDTLTGRMYNPQDPLGLNMEGDKKQNSTLDYNGTNGFDPNKFSYMYAGMASAGGLMSGAGQSFIPSYVKSGIFQNLPNYHNSHTEHRETTVSPVIPQHGITDNEENEQKPNGSYITVPTFEVKGSVDPRHEVQTPGITTPLSSEHIPKSIPNTVNITNMFPNPLFHGQSGILRLGSDIEIAKPRLIANITLINQEHVSDLASNGYPGTIGTYGRSDEQHAEDGHKNSSTRVLHQDLTMYQNIKPVNNYDIPHLLETLPQQIENGTASSHTFHSNYIQAVMPVTSGYDWQGEWPGNSDSENKQDWSSGWAKNLENKNSNQPSTTKSALTPHSNDGTVDGTADGTDEVGTLGFMTSAVDGSSGGITSDSDNTDTLGDMQKTLDVFQKFLSFLSNLNIPVGRTTHTKDDYSYNAMANSWAKDVHA